MCLVICFYEVNRYKHVTFLIECLEMLLGVLTGKNDQVYSKHEYQHKSTRVNTNQYESTRVRHEPTRINTSLTQVNTSSTRVNTNQHESNTSQHESDTSQHESTRVQNRSR